MVPEASHFGHLSYDFLCQTPKKQLVTATQPRPRISMRPTYRMNRTTNFFVALMLVQAVRSSLPLPVYATDRPNIIFIFSDDHARHAISAYGSKVNQTPTIDRIASGGARFANAFVTNSICTPSRATLLTGQYSHLNGVPVFNRFDGRLDHVAKRLGAGGYHTGMIGKWHLGHVEHMKPL